MQNAQQEFGEIGAEVLHSTFFLRY